MPIIVDAVSAAVLAPPSLLLDLNRKNSAIGMTSVRITVLRLRTKRRISRYRKVRLNPPRGGTRRETSAFSRSASEMLTPLSHLRQVSPRHLPSGRGRRPRGYGRRSPDRARACL